MLILFVYYIYIFKTNPFTNGHMTVGNGHYCSKRARRLEGETREEGEGEGG